MATSKTKLLPLTGLRFFLALWVVVFHQSFYPGSSWTSNVPKPFTDLLHTGYMAVGMFFVLSGFVLSYNYRLDESWVSGQMKRFAIARFARIYPAYSIGLLLSTPWVVALLLANHSSATVGRESVKTILAWTALQAWVPWAAEAWNGPGWSLSVEAFFYCCFPFLGVALWRLSRPWALLCAAVAICAAALIAPAIAVSLPLTSSGGVPATEWTPDTSGFWVNFVKFNPLVHLPEFSMGLVLGRVYQVLRDKGTILIGRGYWLYLPALLLEVAAILTCQGNLYPFLHDGLLLPLHSLLILGLALDGGALARFLSIPPLVFLGNASYSMYIFQAPVAGWMFFIVKRIFATQPGGLGVTALFVAVLAAFSSVVFKLLEEPANRILKKRLGSSSSALSTKSGPVSFQPNSKAIRAVG